MTNEQSDPIWEAILEEARQEVIDEPTLGSFYCATILNHKSLAESIAYHLAIKLAALDLSALSVREVIVEAFKADGSIIESVREDLKAVRERDAACSAYSTPLLHFKGFNALQAYRIAHWLWNQGRKNLALYFQSRISEVFSLDIHPAAQMGHGIMIDHASGVVIGETAVVANNVSMLHDVTLGGTGKHAGDRHPKIREGVLIGAGAKILGNVVIGEGAKVAAGSVVLSDVEPHRTVAGIPAKVVGRPLVTPPAFDMDQRMNWDHYVI